MYRDSKTIYIVDNDHTFCADLASILTASGYDVVCFADTDTLLAAAETAIPLCILCGLEVRGSTGVEMVRRLNAPTYPAPVLMMSDERRTVTAIGLIKEGAYDFLEMPFSGTELVQRIERAKLLFARNGYDHSHSAAHDRLTNREQEVLTQWVAGATTKEIARKLGISPRTIEIHRSRIMKKFHAKNSAEIVKLALSGAVSFESRPRRIA